MYRHIPWRTADAWPLGRFPRLRQVTQVTDAMETDVSLVPLKQILRLRELYRQEVNCQIVHDSWHERGFTDSYLIRRDGQIAGYGRVAGERAKRKDVIKEFYILPIHRAAALPLFRRLAAASQARKVEAQTNDILLTLMLFDCARRIKNETILFTMRSQRAFPFPESLFEGSLKRTRGGSSLTRRNLSATG